MEFAASAHAADDALVVHLGVIEQKHFGCHRIDGIKAVYSPEPVDASAVITEGVDEQNKVSNVGTISYLPAAFGIFCASVVINDLLGK